MLYILLIALEILHYGLGQSSTSPCQIKFPFSSNFISAFYEQDITGIGCSTNATTASQEEVHVINLLNAGPILRNDVGEVSLDIKSKNDEELWKKPLIFVLNSHQPVRWKVKMEILALIKIKHIFVIPRYSKVRLMKGPIKTKGKFRKVDDLSSNRDELLQWTRDEYDAITSFTELKKGNRILLDVGQAKYATPECHIEERPNLSAVATYEQPQILSGCSVPTRTDPKYSERVVFIVELDRVSDNRSKKTMVDVEFDIKGDRKQKTQQNFILVLKSPSNVKWRVKTRKIKGTIDIVGPDPQNVDMENIRMDTVGSRPEDFMDTGQDFIKWVEQYIGQVAVYTRIGQANKIKLVLPDADVPSGVTVVIDPFEQPNKTKDVFKQVLHKECNTVSGLTVAINKDFIKSFDLMAEQLTFLSPSCMASENSTHVILETSPSSCKTRTVEIRGRDYFTNKILIHKTKINNDVLETGSGNGYDDADDDELSGSGSHDPVFDTHMDDEDFTSSIIMIDVMCEISDIMIDPEHTSQRLPDFTPPSVGFELKLFQSGTYINRFDRFPIALKVGSRVFAQASIKADVEYRVQVHNCSLSPHMDQHNVDSHTLIENGCRVDSSFKWHTIHGSQNQRFSFIPRNKYKYDFFFLQCRLSICRQGSSSRHTYIPQCTSDPMEYWQNCHQAGRSSSPIISQDVVLGPITLQTRQFEPIKPSTIKATTVQRWEVHTKPGVLPTKSPEMQANSETIIVEGLDSATVVGIAFAAFIIGIILMAALWFIHTHTGPIKHAVASRGGLDLSGDSTPSSTAPIHT